MTKLELMAAAKANGINFGKKEDRLLVRKFTKQRLEEIYNFSIEFKNRKKG